MNKGLIDLHVHSKYSGEGIIVNASTILNLCLANGVQTIAITDHNSAHGCRDALKYLEKNKDDFKDVRFIPGIEISCDATSVSSYMENGIIQRSSFSGGVHVLGYGIDPYNPRYLEMEKYYSTSRGKRVLGIYKFIRRYYGISVDKAQIDSVLSTKGVNPKNLLSRCLSLGDKAYFKNSGEYVQFLHDEVVMQPEKFDAFRERVQDCMRAREDALDGYAKQDVYEMIDLIEASGGVAVLAHPTLYRPKMELAMSDFALLKVLVEKLTEGVNPFTGKHMKGLVGIEMLHGRCFDEQFKYKFFDNLVQEKGLYISGGSDSHITKPGNNNFFGTVRQNYSIVSLDFVDDFDKIKNAYHRLKNFKSTEQQATLKNDYQIIKASEIIKGRTISEKLNRFEREISGQVYFLKAICKGGDIEINREQIKKLEYWTWVYHVYFNSIMESKEVLFKDRENFTNWTEQRKQFVYAMYNELLEMYNIPSITMQPPKNCGSKKGKHKKNRIAPFQQPLEDLYAIAQIINGEKLSKDIDNYCDTYDERML